MLEPVALPPSTGRASPPSPCRTSCRTGIGRRPPTQYELYKGIFIAGTRRRRVGSRAVRAGSIGSYLVPPSPIRSHRVPPCLTGSRWVQPGLINSHRARRVATPAHRHPTHITPAPLSNRRAASLRSIYLTTILNLHPSVQFFLQ